MSEKIGFGSRAVLRAFVTVLLLATLPLMACESVSDLLDGASTHPDRVVSTEELKSDAFPGEPRDATSVEEMPGVEPPIGGTGQDASAVPPDQRLIIRSLGIRIQVDDVEPAVAAVRDEVEGANGIVTGVQVSTDEDIPIYRYEATGPLADGSPLRGFVIARIPPENLDDFIDAVSDLGAVLRQAEDESDVTQEHIDISARLDNLKAQEQRLRDFFERAENVEEMLAIEKELGRVRGDIESLTAQLEYLERQASMATVTIELAGKPPVISPAGEDWGFLRAITAGFRGMAGTINAMIVLVMSALPLVVVGVLVWLGVRRMRRRRRASAGISPESPEESPQC